MDFSDVKTINEYFYLKKDDHVFLCQITDINDGYIYYNINGYLYQTRYYPYVSELKMLIRNFSDSELFCGINYNQVSDKISLHSPSEETLLELNDAISFFNDIILYLENTKNNKLEQFKKLNNSKLKFIKSDIIDKESLRECVSKNSAILSYIESSENLINLFETIEQLKSNSNTTTKCLEYIQLVNDNAIKMGLK